MWTVSVWFNYVYQSFSIAEDSDAVETYLGHDSMHEIMVDGKQAPGSYSRRIMYSANVTQIDQLVHRAHSCRQDISYRCESSRLLSSPGSNNNPGNDGSDDGTGPGE